MQGEASKSRRTYEGASNSHSAPAETEAGGSSHGFPAPPSPFSFMHLLLVRFAAVGSDKRRLARAPFLPRSTRSEQDGDAAGRSLWLPPETQGWPLFAGFLIFSPSP